MNETILHLKKAVTGAAHPIEIYTSTHKNTLKTSAHYKFGSRTHTKRNGE